MVAKRVTAVGCSLLQITGEVQLCTQRASGFDRFCLLPLPPPNDSGSRKLLLNIFRTEEKAAVVICENDITRLHFEIAEACAECILIRNAQLTNHLRDSRQAAAISQSNWTATRLRNASTNGWDGA